MRPDQKPNRRCAIISPYSDQRGGAELSLLHALRGRVDGVEWVLAVPKEGEIEAESRSLGVPVCVYGESRMRDPLGYLRAARKIGRFARDHRCDLILSWDAHAHFRAAGVAAFTSIPTAWFQKGGVGQSLRDRALARLPARGILANSQYTAHRQARLQLEVNRERPIYVVPSAVDRDLFNPLELPTPERCRDRLGLPIERPLITMVGRLQAWKGFHVVVEALPKIRERVPNTELLFVGGEHWSEPGYADRLRRLASDLGVADSVRLVGHAPHGRIAEYMNAADVIVHASVGEPFGIVVIEALALGKPTVAANVGGPTTIIRHGIDGLLADPTDPAAIASQVIRLLREEDLKRSLAKAALERASLFGVEKFRRRLGESVNRLVDNERRSGVILDPELTSAPAPESIT